MIVTLAHQFEGLWARLIKRGGLIAFLMSVISWFYGLIIRIRNRCYDVGLFPTHKVEARVISIGNLVMGGTGKTPLTMAVAKALSGKRVAVVARGYRGGVEKAKRPVEISKGHGPQFPWAYCGDEPYMLAHNLPGVRVIAGRDRVRGAKMATGGGANVILLDDGMQHRRLHRDQEIVVVDGRNPLSSLDMFPMGRLREPISGLERADLVVVTQLTESIPQALRSEISRWTSAPLVGISYAATCEVDIEGKLVGMLSAIAKPDRFRTTIAKLGGEIVAEMVRPDHAEIEPKELEAFAKRCKERDAEVILCTEKDWVKRPLTSDLGLPLVPVKIVPTVIEGQHFLTELLEKS